MSEPVNATIKSEHHGIYFSYERPDGSGGGFDGRDIDIRLWNEYDPSSRFHVNIDHELGYYTQSGAFQPELPLEEEA